MVYVAYNGVHRRDPQRVARLVTPDGLAFHVVRMPGPRDAAGVVEHLGGVVHRRCECAIEDVLDRASLTGF